MDMDRLHNWVRAHQWYRARGRAFSLEGRYRPPRGVEVEYETGDPPPKAPIPIDILDAWDVELAWRRCSAVSRWTLKAHYHDKMEPVKACNLLRRLAGLYLRPHQWREYLRAGRYELGCELEDLRLAA